MKSSNRTFVSMFSGGGLADVGLKAAGYTPIGACEVNPEVAEVYRINFGDHIEVGDVRHTDPIKWKGATLLWASPPCQAYSVARAKGLPTREDADVGLDILRWAEAINPTTVVVENVPGYRDHATFVTIVDELIGMGYLVKWGIMDAADYGVPQSRKRLITVASRHSVWPMPNKEKHSGWFAAVRDLVPTFPVTRLAPWQLQRLPEVEGTILVGGGSAGKNIPYSLSTEPSITIKANSGGKEPMRVRMADGRVLKLTSRAIARLQTVPDSYVLPQSAALAGHVIGNGVPCLLSQRIAESVNRCELA